MTTQRRLRPAPWGVYLGGATLLALVYFVVPSPWDNIPYELLAASSVAAICFGARVMPRRLPWYLLGAGQACFLVAEVAWSVYDFAGEVPFPSVADIFYLAAYPFAAVGLVVLIRDRSPGKDRASLIDAATVSVVMGLLAWIFLIEPYVRDRSAGLLEVVVSVGYPLMDVLLLAVAVRLVIGGGLRSTAVSLLAAGVAATLLADVAYGYVGLTSGYTKGLMDVGWIANYLLWGAAAMHPSARRISEKSSSGAERPTPVRLGVLTAAALVPPATLLLQHEFGPQVTHVRETMMVTGIVFLLVLARMADLNRHIHGRMHQLHSQGKVLQATLDERNAVAERLRHQAYHDSLTGLGNRMLFVERTAEALARRGGRDLALLFIDIDDFKNANDKLGHAAGDELLVAIGQRLRGSLRAGDIAARLGGDEFALLVFGVDGEPEARRVALRVLEAFEGPFSVAGTSVRVHASVGVAMPMPGARRAQDLIRNADDAMYSAKRRGKNRYEIFEPGPEPSGVVDIGVGT